MFEILLFGWPIENDVVSRAIQARLRSPYSHSAIRVDGETIYECHWPNVRKVTNGEAKVYGARAIAHCIIPATDEQVANGVKWAESTLGDRYDLLDLAALGLGISSELPHEYVCSSFVACFLGHAGVKVYDNPASETPKTLAVTWNAQLLAGSF